MDNKPTPGFARGGRGANLLALLQQQPRRPGQVSPPREDIPAPTEAQESRPVGRGAVFQALSRGRGLIQSQVSDLPGPSPVSDAPRPSPVPDLPRPTGRGRGLALATLLAETAAAKPSEAPQIKTPSPTEVTSVKTPSPPLKPPSPPSTTGSRRNVSPLVPQFEHLSLSNYRGESGFKMPLEVNYVRIKTIQDKGIYEYHVSFNPQIDSKSMKFRIMNDPKVKEIIGSVRTFDGAILYLPRLFDSSAPIVIQVNLPTDNSLVTVTIKFVKTCLPKDLMHLYNLLFKKVMRILKLTQVGRNYFDPKGGIPVPQHRLEIWPGYVTAVQEYEGGVMLNCDASFRVLRNVTAKDLMQEASRQSAGRKDEIMKMLVGCVVLTRYNNKTYRVDDIAWDMHPEETFATHDGSSISYVDYYKRSYDITIRDLRQPLLISKAKQRDRKDEGDEPKLICLIPELCYMTGLTDAMRNDFKVMKDIAVYTRVAPADRQKALQRFVDNIKNTPEAKNCFESWNLELDERPLKLEGRTLEPEKILFGGNREHSATPDADWGRQIGVNPVLLAVHLENWIVVCTKRDAPKVRDFYSMMTQVCPKMGIHVTEPQFIEITNDRTETYLAALRDLINNSLQMVVCIFPTPRDDRYSAIKKLCCIEMPVPSQVINVKTISDQRKLRSVVQKIALQMNCKLGGELWSVKIPLQNLMICGMDTYHDNSKGRRSVLAFVSSINQNRTRWFSMTVMQRQGQEVGDSLRILFLAALKKYHEVNHKLPDKIILYRDGVGDGQLEFVSKYEVEQLTACFKNFALDYKPCLTVIVVQKRINTRMYAIQGNDRLANPQPGTLLDHSVGRKNWYDFFLVSQHVRQGTVSPTHYVVIYDTSSMKPDHQQRIAFKMTHMYYNWPGTVRVPAPCQYAHKLAFLVGQSLHTDTHRDLSDRLFYL